MPCVVFRTSDCELDFFAHAGKLEEVEEMPIMLRMLLTFGLMTILTGCTSIGRNPHIRENGSLDPEPVTIWSRPAEFGVQIIGDISGTAFTTRLFGFTVGGDSVQMANPYALLREGDTLGPLERVAAAHAIDSQPGADGIYVIQTSSSSTNIAWIYTNKSVTVRGKALKLEDLGYVSEERADRARALESLSQSSHPGVIPFATEFLGLLP